MRRLIAALCLIGAVVGPKKAEALSCALPLSTSWYRSPDVNQVSVEKKRRDMEARATLELLERTPIILRGRVVSSRLLSDLRKTNSPISLIVLDHVEMLKGRLFTAPTDRKAFIIKEYWCDGTCESRENTLHWPRGETLVVGASRNDMAEPSKMVDPDSKLTIYQGRIDAMVGACTSGPLTPEALDLLNAPQEVARLKREYLRRRPDH
ncbi:hypothetical protein [Bradyrhizobium sp. CCBAU 51753]|uniref:hypothetical protein n=1 Tax=Bradyrhizobium sp. CCBAU 51753 TaxID=1325100 RepID=UPI00188DC083|nr:hypothetical protein [Bradyrhizobium sp. CCBAU 51753]QOZ22303.1 hypothetical protein XH93_00540 [Bradyrhizobium sp. CCBAU 51753]